MRRNTTAAANTEKGTAARSHTRARSVLSDLPMDGLETDANQALCEPLVAQRRGTTLVRAKGKNKGAGRHKRGYRDSFGCMCMNMREGVECPKGWDAHEGSTLAELVRQIRPEDQFVSLIIESDSVTKFVPPVCFQEHLRALDYRYQAGQGSVTWGLLFRRKSLRQLLPGLDEAGLNEGDVLVSDLLDGGETVYYRLYDEDGTYVKYVH